MDKSVETKQDQRPEGQGEHDEIKFLKEFRLAGYSSASRRLFRYLNYTSDFGEAMKPVTQLRLVHLSHMLSIGYCIADIGLEAYNLRCRGYMTKDNRPLNAQRYFLQRSIFQGLSTILFPYGIINATIGLGKLIFRRAGSFQRYGPSILALCVIPLMPKYIDKPIEEAVEFIFEQLSNSEKKVMIEQKIAKLRAKK